MSRWVKYRGAERCACCGRKSPCTRSADGQALNCFRTPSATVIKDRKGNFNGYLHPVGTGVRLAPVQAPPPPPRRRHAELVAIARQFATAVSPARLERLAGSLGLSVASLRRLGVGRAEGFEMPTTSGKTCRVRAWSFPMVDSRGRVVGFRFRTDDGHKFSLTGGREGLFVPANLPWGEASINPARPLLVCEGPTSLAALLDLGFAAIGRPSCSGGVAEVRRWLDVGPRRHVVVVGDNDEEKRRPDGTVFFPGQDGARVLAAAVAGVARSVRILIPPVRKDCRDWLKSGATRADVAAAIAALAVVRKAA